MTNLKRAKWMLSIVAFGLFLSGVTVWPAATEMKMLIQIIWGDSVPTGVLHQFAVQVITGLAEMEAKYPFLLYAHDWLAFAHIMLAILFAGAILNPVRNIWIIQCGLIMCACVPILAGICIPLRGLPWFWVLIDSAFAPAAGLPLWIALRDVRLAERTSPVHFAGRLAGSDH